MTQRGAKGRFVRTTEPTTSDNGLMIVCAIVFTLLVIGILAFALWKGPASEAHPKQTVEVRDGRTVPAEQPDNILRCTHGKPLAHPCAACANERYREVRR